MDTKSRASSGHLGDTGGEEFLSPVVTVDETLVRYRDPNRSCSRRIGATRHRQEWSSCVLRRQQDKIMSRDLK